MQIDKCTRADFDYILAHVPDYWGEARADHMRSLHHPFLLHQFGNTALVARNGSGIAGYLFGFLSQVEPAAYVHLIAVRPADRGQGVGRCLYQYFKAYAREHGCTSLQAITSPGNHASIAFHRRIGMTLLGDPNGDGVPVVRDYSGPGQDRVVFRMTL